MTTANPWNTKGTFETILSDIKRLALDIISKSGGLVSMNDKFKLITSPRVLASLNFVDNQLNTISIAQRASLATSSLPTKPVENGGFKNDSRINNPDIINIQIQIKAFEYELGNYIAIIEKAKNGTEIFDIVTPQRTFFDMALKGYDYINNQNKNMLIFNLEFQQIRITKLLYNAVQNPKNLNNSNTKSRSNVKPTQVSEEKKKSLATKIFKR